jgi:dihydroorotate dehydrogenase (NAD+) catalytic subunit
MLNAVGLQNPGVEAWLDVDLPALMRRGARVVASIWGTSVEEYQKAAALLWAGRPDLVAIEVNVSCPNLGDTHRMFSQSASATAEAVGAVSDAIGPSGPPLWAKLSPNVTDLTEIAAAALDAGAGGLTLVNTLMGMAVDPASAAPLLGAGAGGLSGPALHPVAVKAVFECRDAFPEAPIVGVGGVMRGEDAAEVLAAGADAVQVGTATFADPRAPLRVLEELSEWCSRHGVDKLSGMPRRARRPPGGAGTEEASNGGGRRGAR